MKSLRCIKFNMNIRRCNHILFYFRIMFIITIVGAPITGAPRHAKNDATRHPTVFSTVDTGTSTQWGLHKMADILQTSISNEFSWLEIFVSWSRFINVYLTNYHHWFRQWLNAQQSRNSYLYQWWLNSETHRRVIRPQCVNCMECTSLCFSEEKKCFE